MSLLIRADASATMGTGHVMRCLALAQAWKENGGPVTFALANPVPGLVDRLRTDGFAVELIPEPAAGPEDAARTFALAQQLQVEWVVLDGYHFSGRFEQLINHAGLRLLALDDYGHVDHHSADVVLNQNLHATPALYPGHDPATRLLLGPRYALLRREFWRWRGWKRTIPQLARHVLVTLGGSDPGNVTARVVEALSLIKGDGLEAVIVVGAANPRFEEIRSLCATLGPKFQVVCNVRNMPELMAWADLVVSAGGSTCWELAFMGLPSLLLVLADNQVSVCQSLGSAGAAIELGPVDLDAPWNWATSLETALRSQAQRTRMSTAGQQMVDGHGAERVARLLRLNPLRISLRPALPEDGRRLWEWANDPSVRSRSFQTQPIPWETHVAWFAHNLCDPRCVLFIAQDGEGIPVGQIRFNIKEHEAEVSINLAPRSRGLGYGTSIIAAGVEKVCQTKGVRTIHAYVKEDNLASLRAFLKAGFQRSEISHEIPYPALHLVLDYDSYAARAA